MPNSTNRRKQKIVFFGFGVFAMRLCKNCSLSFVSKPCRIVESFEKYVACVNSGRFCNLVSFDTVRWRKLKEKRKRLKVELKKSYAKQQRLLRQIDFVEKKQQVMVDGEFRNIEKLEHEEALVEGFLPDFIFLIDVASKQLVLFVGWEDWSVLPDGTVAEKSGNSQNS